MKTSGKLTRRRGALTAASCLLPWLAACSPAAPTLGSPVGSAASPTQRPTQRATTAAVTPAAATATLAEGKAAAGLDLRYANVLAVEFEQLDDGRYRFHVTLQHDDDGEAPEYADAWQVEDLEGSVLGVRELLHSHGNQPFTRSHTIEIPPDVEVVIVRGHDQRHGYGGQIMRVNLRSGETAPLAAAPSPAP